MGIGRIFKRIALIIAILGIAGVIFFIVLISLIRLDFRKELDIPISKKEKELFEEIEDEIGFVADTSSRYIYREECCNYELVYNIEFYNKGGEECTDSIFRKQSIKFYDFVKKDTILSKLSKKKNIVIRIEYKKNNIYYIKILKNKHFLYHWSEGDTIFLNKGAIIKDR
ncbi:hypothetical protein [Capnocytophaga catalasegens]|uniref:DUF4352 domain-containing protein n=1 Tax=Capnocytophaga catalasegens TaxID=1004260 RepID=A0AAV5B0H8_9FLAO|nr:hypothetical protein [Capnocytophaga catalasegens]GIZ16386.1 hypothetical protein RCZ03_23860 [Capnocytophaga catalasegens]GJM51460.1 hypothetical protein RCZ15_24330 [Capnocytophaga catalasegens]GJM53725.1 hypothetical protein RCZ16_20410 [Capnocytophaga catalasegens]